MRMAKASKRDIDMTIEFFQLIEEFMDNGTVLKGEEEHDVTDEEFVAIMREMWGRRFGPCKVDAAWTRVVFGCSTLIDNCCDPSLDYLDWKPEYKAAIEAMEAAKSTEECDGVQEAESGEGTTRAV